MIKLSRNIWIIIVIGIIFIAPGVSAYFFYSNPTWIGGVETNRGTLIKPPVLLPEFDKNENWRLVYYSSDKCDAECLGNLDKLARVRLALGRHLYNVDVYLLIDNKTQDISEKQAELFQDIGTHVLKFDRDNQQYKKLFGGSSGFYIVSPQNYAILTYKHTILPDDIFQDIKKLVND